MKQRSIVIAIAVLATNLLAGVFAILQQLVYADDSSETQINIEEKKEVDINGDGNTVPQCSKNNLDSFRTALEVIDSECSKIESELE
jgi:uncharacterized protein involved in exopolysaccharide biosynthesis